MRLGEAQARAQLELAGVGIACSESRDPGGDHEHPANDVVRRGGETADQLAITWVNDPSAFTAAGGRRVGEIAIEVAADGRSYTVDGEERRAFTDSEEAAGDDED